MATAYASADIFVFPSTTDTFGNVILEAQACGLPVIVSDSGGPKELVEDGMNGLITRSRDVDDFTRAIRSLVDRCRIAGAHGQRRQKERHRPKLAKRIPQILVRDGCLDALMTARAANQSAPLEIPLVSSTCCSQSAHMMKAKFLAIAALPFSLVFRLLRAAERYE